MSAPDVSGEDTAPRSGNAAGSAERATYRAYVEHRVGCFQCINTPVLCATGRSLWDAYKAAST